MQRRSRWHRIADELGLVQRFTVVRIHNHARVQLLDNVSSTPLAQVPRLVGATLVEAAGHAAVEFVAQYQDGRAEDVRHLRLHVRLGAAASFAPRLRLASAASQVEQVARKPPSHAQVLGTKMYSSAHGLAEPRQNVVVALGAGDSLMPLRRCELDGHVELALHTLDECRTCELTRSIETYVCDFLTSIISAHADAFGNEIEPLVARVEDRALHFGLARRNVNAQHVVRVAVQNGLRRVRTLAVECERVAWACRAQRIFVGGRLTPFDR